MIGNTQKSMVTSYGILLFLLSFLRLTASDIETILVFSKKLDEAQVGFTQISCSRSQLFLSVETWFT
jgi:hypothetical protein